MTAPRIYLNDSDPFVPAVAPQFVVVTAAARADGVRLVGTLESLALRARIVSQRRISRELTPWRVPINGRETRAERAYMDSILREELDARRPQAAFLVRKFARRHGAALLPPTATRALELPEHSR